MQPSPLLGVAPTRGKLLAATLVILTSAHGCLLPELGVATDAGSGGVGTDGSGGMGGDVGDGQGGTSGGASTGGTGSGGTDDGSGGDDASGGSGGSGGSGDGGSDTGGANGSGGGSSGGGSAGTPSPGCGRSLTLSSGNAEIDVDGTLRDYYLDIPVPYEEDTPYSLIFAFHPYNATNSEVVGGGYYGVGLQPDSNAIFVAPNSPDAWADSSGRDIAMVEAIRTHVSAELCVDEDRIFALGFSAGGMMANRIGCTLADTFDGIAAISGYLPSSCDNTGSIPVWNAHGDEDNVVQWDEAKEAVDLFVSRNGCSTSMGAVVPAPCVAFAECDVDAPVYYCLWDGAHEVPSFAGEAIWDFFQQL